MMRLRSSLWVVLVTLPVAVLGCQEERDIATVSPDVLETDADFIVFGGEQYITQEGRTEAHVVYDTAYQWADSASVSLRRVELTIYNEDGSERARMTSDRGLLDQLTDRMIARGNVVLVVPGEDRTLRTPELHYDPERGMIWSDSTFEMRTARQTLSGCRFDSDLEFRNFNATRCR